MKKGEKIYIFVQKKKTGKAREIWRKRKGPHKDTAVNAAGLSITAEKDGRKRVVALSDVMRTENWKQNSRRAMTLAASTKVTKPIKERKSKTSTTLSSRTTTRTTRTRTTMTKVIAT